jgi:hypothetical protein
MAFVAIKMGWTPDSKPILVPPVPMRQHKEKERGVSVAVPRLPTGVNLGDVDFGSGPAVAYRRPPKKCLALSRRD